MSHMTCSGVVLRLLTRPLSSCKQSLQADVATVLRGKRLMVMPACDLVPGDIVEIAGPFPFTFSCTFGGRC